jgi:uncharacterized membrane protein YoaK (UPF0700 family)
MKFLNKNVARTAFITCFSTFILGYLNAYSLLFRNASLVSPQTGNLVNLGIRLSQGNTEGLLNNLMLFGGFAVGCFIAPWVASKISNKKKEFFISWTIFAIPAWLNLLLMGSIPPALSIFTLSFTSGIGLCFFRKIGKLDLNNNIMTGNLKNMFGTLFEVTILKNKEKSKNFILYAVTILLFFIGALVAGLVSKAGESSTLWVVSILYLIPYIAGLGLHSEE